MIGGDYPVVGLVTMAPNADRAELERGIGALGGDVQTWTGFFCGIMAAMPATCGADMLVRHANAHRMHRAVAVGPAARGVR